MTETPPALDEVELWIFRDTSAGFRPRPSGVHLEEGEVGKKTAWPSVGE